MTRISALALAAITALAAGPAGAASGALYRVTFDATWSAATHPTDFPSNPHFSQLIGATHDSDVSFWQTGTLASAGIELMAELGSTGGLALEVQAAIDDGDAVSLITGGGTNSPGSVSTTFKITSPHPLVTLVSMIAPSPDWFVGVSGLSLYSGGQWQSPVVVSLDPYDSGTDSGVTFLSPNDDTQPPENVSQIAGFPFTGTPPLGTFTFELIRVLDACEDLLDNDLDTLADHPADPGCDSASDTSEKSPSLVCDDGNDNDGDTLIDFPEDNGCSSPADASETVDAALPALSPSGTGGLIALLALGAFWSLRRSPGLASDVEPDGAARTNALF